MSDRKSAFLLVLLCTLALFWPAFPSVARPAPVVYASGDLPSGWYSIASLPVSRITGPLQEGSQVMVVGHWGIVHPLETPVLQKQQKSLTGKIRINHASPEELEQLPGVGPVLARRIFQGKPYRNLQDLDVVKGIGPRMLQKLSRWLEFG